MYSSLRVHVCTCLYSVLYRCCAVHIAIIIEARMCVNYEISIYSVIHSET